ncbi:copper resistance CopC/CopD family protein [Sinorhizobium fredii]|uniref:copper resistance CopC/CopD family protein n=1 Tax=Rhizobium fredii TaxID=380 RepID=UPI0005956EC8|nr:copper resistance CopC/CopD family protein [Sinorhizobium fredii]WOS63916.1 copper resistance CopC/CopD family protein [Sinorhizobium fredii GR64]
MVAARKPHLNGHRPTRIPTIILLACSAWLWFAVAAFAHASLVETSPVDNAVLTEAPATFSMTFSEPVSPLALRLVKPDGSSTSLERFVLRDRRLDVDSPHDLAQGTHVLSWRVISEDGHPIGGSVVFSIGMPSATSPEAAGQIDWPVRTAVWLAKIALYLGLVLGIGGAFAVTWLGRGERSGSLASLVLLGIGLVGAALSVVFQGVDALGVSFERISDAAAWQAGMNTSFGRTAVFALLASVIAILALAANGRSGRLLSLAALTGTGLALALSGHASIAEPQWLTRTAVFLHGVTVAFWAGALIPLGLALARRTPASAGMLRRFSGTIPLLLGCLIVTGLLLGVVQVQKPPALLTTAYGEVFLVKLALLVPVLVLAALNRWRWTEPAEHRDPSAMRRLSLSVAAEAAIVILIFGVVAAWRFTPPPRALALATAQPTVVHIHTDKAMANVQLSPRGAGQVEASIDLSIGDFEALNAKEVTLVLAHPSAGVEAIRRSARRTAGENWRIDQILIPLPGTWHVRIDILISDFEIVKLVGEAEIHP